ncbi:hypothetical protein OCOJLMKI_1341 [Methylobacterium iners]|uniref:Uncharacterized protein n=2 Tax=Methylobacterium iners TaxID=418707 RepID=A0ABQ4RWS0_9HYPH|nr:hypothetical protein OCOJLMKI_1341 [Methylobacterium iners]
MSVVIPFPSRSHASSGPTLRRSLEDAAQTALDLAEQVIELLDLMDGDPDAEDGGDAEGSLGAPERPGSSQVIWFRGDDRDREQEAHPA